MGKDQFTLDGEEEQQSVGQDRKERGTACDVCFYLCLKGRVLAHRFTVSNHGAALQQERSVTQMAELLPTYNPNFLFYYRRNKGDGPIPKFK